jgi:hypothetical protein
VAEGKDLGASGRTHGVEVRAEAEQVRPLVSGQRVIKHQGHGETQGGVT